MAAVTVLLNGRLSVVDEPTALTDHSGRPVDPLTPTGLRYRWRMQQPDSPRTFYGSDADAVLTVLIDDYPDPAGDLSAPEGAGHEHPDTVKAGRAAYQARVRYAAGVIMNAFAAAVMSGELSVDEERVLGLSTDHTAEHPVITREDLPRWDHPRIPMVLIKELYLPAEGILPPGGNIIWLRAGTAELFLQSLAAFGVIALREDDAYTQLPPTQITLHRPTGGADAGRPDTDQPEPQAGHPDVAGGSDG